MLRSVLLFIALFIFACNAFVSNQLWARKFQIKSNSKKHSIDWKSAGPLQSKDSELKVLLLVEPTPFNYVSGYANRFKETLNNLKMCNDSVEIITPDPDPNHPHDYLQYPITTLRGFKCPKYNHLTLSVDTRLKTGSVVKRFKPDVLHVSTPSVLVFPAIFWARLFNIPLVMSFHTNIVEYAKAYFRFVPPSLLDFVGSCYMRFIHQFADLVLCTSPQLRDQMEASGIRRVDVWQKGINTQVVGSVIVFTYLFVVAVQWSCQSLIQLSLIPPGHLPLRDTRPTSRATLCGVDSPTTTPTRPCCCSWAAWAARKSWRN